jgi:hypothetical protein
VSVVTDVYKYFVCVISVNSTQCLTVKSSATFATKSAAHASQSRRWATTMCPQLLIVDEAFWTQDSEGCDRLIAAINA